MEETVLFPCQKFHISLAPLDALHPHHTVRYLFIFRCTSESQSIKQVEALKHGVQALVAQCPILGGRVIPRNPNEAGNDGAVWRTIVFDRGLELTIRDVRSQLQSFEELAASNFPPSQLPYDLLVPLREYVEDDGSFPACRLQYSLINGGSVLTWAMSHSVADGVGVNELIRILAEKIRLAQEQQANGPPKSDGTLPPEILIGINRSPVDNMHGNIPFDIANHPAFTQLTFSRKSAEADIQNLPQSFFPEMPEKSIILRIPAEGLARLKAHATPPRALPSESPISTHDAICALMWRSTLLLRSKRMAHQISKEELSAITSRLFMPSDARRHLQLPSTYVGNAVYQLAASLDLATLLSPTEGLQAAAKALRYTIKAVTSDLVRSYMAELQNGWITWRFMDGSTSTTSVGMGTDWTSGQLVYDEDWGDAFGQVVSYRYPSVEGGLVGNCILPKRRDGGADVMIAVADHEVDMLKSDECFGKYLDMSSM